jgi:hypothetical protein
LSARRDHRSIHADPVISVALHMHRAVSERREDRHASGEYEVHGRRAPENPLWFHHGPSRCSRRQQLFRFLREDQSTGLMPGLSRRTSTSALARCRQTAASIRGSGVFMVKPSLGAGVRGSGLLNEPVEGRDNRLVVLGPGESAQLERLEGLVDDVVLDAHSCRLADAADEL